MTVQDEVMQYMEINGKSNISTLARKINRSWITTNTAVAYLIAQGKLIEEKKFGKSRVITLPPQKPEVVVCSA